MVNRRAFIFRTTGLVVTGLMAGCSQAAATTLNVKVLQGSIPAEVLQSFKKQSGTPVSFQLVGQVRSLFQQLQRWQKPALEDSSWGRFLPWTQTEEKPTTDDLVSLGDYWLESAIQQDLIAPLELPEATLSKLPLPWQQFVRRDGKGQIETNAPSQTEPSQPLEDEVPDDPDSQSPRTASKNALWAAPYKVQTLVIVYRQSFFPQSSAENPPFKSWSDLLQPNLRQQIALPNHPRLIIGLLQKLQGGSFNLPIEIAASLARMKQQLAEPFAELNDQVKTYDSTNSLKALINRDVKAVVAWSGEAISALRRYQDLRIVVPEEGSLLSADLWVRPKGAAMTEAMQQWIDFCWQDGPATQISVSGQGVSPVFLLPGSEIPEALAQSKLPLTTIQNSEPLLPIPAELQETYSALWQQLRAG